MSGITAKETINQQGSKIVVFRLNNDSNAYVELLNYGATFVSAVVPDKYGNMENVVLRYKNVEDYFSDSYYLGATIGRVSNRISNAQFQLKNQVFFLDKNDGNNSNHGGFHGFNAKIFDYEIQNDQVIFSYESEDGEGGFPGNLRLDVSYSFSNDNELLIEYKAIADKETIFNPTNHAYFDLSAGKANPLDFELKVFAEKYLEANNQFLPTGNILPILDSSFDFSEYRKINELIPLKKEILKGYNTFFIGKETNQEVPDLLASLRDCSSGRILDVYSDMPGVLFYTGDYLSDPFKPFGGLCLEAQLYPDAPNHSHFPSVLLPAKKEQVYHIRYKFGLLS